MKKQEHGLRGVISIEWKSTAVNKGTVVWMLLKKDIVEKYILSPTTLFLWATMTNWYNTNISLHIFKPSAPLLITKLSSACFRSSIIKPHWCQMLNFPLEGTRQYTRYGDYSSLTVHVATHTPSVSIESKHTDRMLHTVKVCKEVNINQ